MKAHYMLRRNLPLWRAEQVIPEAIEYCVLNHVDEIMWKIDVEHFNHGLTPLEIIRQFLPWLEKARAGLAEKGMISSINPWVTLNHADRQRDMSKVYPNMTWMMDASGVSCTACPCPLSSAWQQWLVEAYRLYASTQPYILWIEDDFRLFNHDPVGWGCYCPAHMKALSDEIGRPIDREKLVERLLSPGTPDPIRSTWFDLSGRAMIDVSKQVAKAVHETSPETRLGLMCSDSLDGRWWVEAVTALAGKHQPVARPSFSPYLEVRATALLPDERDHHKEILCLPKDTRICPELENYPYTPFTKSARFTRLELGVSQLFGHAAITMNLFDHVGTSLSVDRRYGKMLREVKPLLNALASRFGQGTERGVQVLFNKRAADTKKLKPGDGMGQLLHHADAEGWARSLQGSGIPVIWSDSPVRCTTGQVLRAIEPEKIRSMLSEGLLVDGSALKVLEDLGFDQFTGVARQGALDPSSPAVAEELFHDQFGGAADTFIALDANTARRAITALAACDGAQTISRFVDMDRHPLCPAMVLYENELGGRVAVYPFELSGGTDGFFTNWHRKRQLGHVVRWLGGGRTILHIEGDTAWTMPIRRDGDGWTLIGIANLETDDWPEIRMTLTVDEAGEPSRISMPDETGSWQTVQPAELTLRDQHVKIVLDTTLPALDFTALLLEWDH